MHLVVGGANHQLVQAELRALQVTNLNIQPSLIPSTTMYKNSYKVVSKNVEIFPRCFVYTSS